MAALGRRDEAAGSPPRAEIMHRRGARLRPTPMSERPPSPRPAVVPLARPQDALRDAITAATRLPEAHAVAALLDAATLDAAAAERTRELATRLATQVRASKRDAAGAEAMVQAYSLSSRGGHGADVPGRGAAAHSGRAHRRRADPRQARAAATGARTWAPADSLFVNAARPGACCSPAARRAGTTNTDRAGRALRATVARAGEPAIRAAMRLAMKIMGTQFVLGRRSPRRWSEARAREAQGFRYSYDMLGEAARTGR